MIAGLAVAGHPISGRQALGRIEQAVAELRRDEERLEGAVRQVTERATGLRAERAEAFRALARLRLSGLEQEALIRDLDAAERQALQLLKDGRQLSARLGQRRRELQGAEERAEAERQEAAQAFEQVVRSLDERRAAVAAEVRGGPEWAEQTRRIEKARQIAEEARKKALQAEQDREIKRKPYEADPLFTYLWSRQFGTPEYQAGGLVRFLDSKVARLIRFDEARTSYRLLNELPGRLRDHAARLEAEIEAERARLTAIERARLVEAGIEGLEARASEAKAALDRAEAVLRGRRDELEAFERENASALTEELAYREAVEVLAGADERLNLGELRRRAALTPTPEDDRLLHRIEATEASIGETEQELGRLSREMRALSQRRGELQRERDEFRRRGYDNPWGVVTNDQILANVLGGILGGALQGAVLRDMWRDHYQELPHGSDPDFGGGLGFPFPQGDPFPDSGSWGGPVSDGFSTGGSFGGSAGDPFRTGGSF
jgi:chromosome segregation ATPase